MHVFKDKDTILTDQERNHKTIPINTTKESITYILIFVLTKNDFFKTCLIAANLVISADILPMPTTGAPKMKLKTYYFL